MYQLYSEASATDQNFLNINELKKTALDRGCADRISLFHDRDLHLLAMVMIYAHAEVQSQSVLNRVETNGRR